MNLNKFKILNFITEKPFALYFIFFILYSIFSVSTFILYDYGDAPRYLYYARNLLNGSFSGSECADIWNTPLYSIILSIMYLFDLPLDYFGGIINSLFLYISIVYIHKTILLFSSKKTAIIFSMIWAFYFPMLIFTQTFVSEILTCMLASIFTYYTALGYNKKSLSGIFLAGIFAGLLILTKAIFAYVFLGMFFVGFILMFIFRRKDMCNISIISALALIVCLPWLYYTYSLTGKYFYFASSGGENLYTASLSHTDAFFKFKRCKNKELYNWDLAADKNDYSIYHPEQIRNDVVNANSLSMVGSCEYLQKRAIENIKAAPIEYACTVFSGILKLIADFSTLDAKACILAFINFTLFLLFILSILLALIRIRTIDTYIVSLYLTILIYLFGTIMLVPLWRQLAVVFPTILVLIAYTFTKYVRIEIKS